MPHHVITCAACGNEFTVATWNRDAKFCSKACANAQRLIHPLAERFWKHVEKTDTCWLWTGSKDPNGYGRILDKPHSQGGKPRLAHRIAWELTNGPILNDLFVCHTCDNPSCVRLDHLFLGDQFDNMHDCSAKGRMHFGEANGTAKLNPDLVRAFRKEYRAGASLAAIGSAYGIPWQTVADIIHGRTWSHIPD